MILHVYTRLEIDWLPTILDVCSTKNSICTSSSILVILIRNICLVINYSVETDQSATNIVKLPLAFIRSGLVYTDGGGVYNVGQILYGWSHTVSSTSSIYNLGVDLAEVYTSGANLRWYGFPLRCLYLGSV